MLAHFQSRYDTKCGLELNIHNVYDLVMTTVCGYIFSGCILLLVIALKFSINISLAESSIQWAYDMGLKLAIIFGIVLYRAVLQCTHSTPLKLHEQDLLKLHNIFIKAFYKLIIRTVPWVMFFHILVRV